MKLAALAGILCFQGSPLWHVKKHPVKDGYGYPLGWWGRLVRAEAVNVAGNQLRAVDDTKLAVPMDCVLAVFDSESEFLVKIKGLDQVPIFFPRQPGFTHLPHDHMSKRCVTLAFPSLRVSVHSNAHALEGSCWLRWQTRPCQSCANCRSRK
jgi:hypothetical protein